MSDRGYTIFLSAAKYLFLNFLATVYWIMLAKIGWLDSEDTIVLIYLIVNCTALILGKLQKVTDKLKEIEKKQEKSENNA